MDGPFLVLERIRNAYWLKLPGSMKIHPIFLPNKLQKAAINPLPGQIEEPSLPVEINGKKE